MHERRRPAPLDERSGRAAAPLAAQHALLAMQRAAGNRAVVQALAGSAPAVQRSATMDLGAWNDQPVESYEMGLNAMTDDIVGHAWVDVKEVGGKGRKRSVGFWPGTWGVLPTADRAS